MGTSALAGDETACQVVRTEEEHQKYGQDVEGPWEASEASRQVEVAKSECELLVEKAQAAVGSGKTTSCQRAQVARGQASEAYKPGEEGRVS